MFDIRALIAALDTTVTTRSDASSIAALLKANIDKATVSTAGPAVLINGARLGDLPGEVGILATPTRVTVVFAESKPPMSRDQGRDIRRESKD